MDRTIKGEWQTRSDIPNRKERLAAHIEFEKSELKQRLDEGWKVESSRIKHRRPRIKTVKTPKQVVVSLGEVMAATITLSWEDYQKHGTGLKIVMRIY